MRTFNNGDIVRLRPNWMDIADKSYSERYTPSDIASCGTASELEDFLFEETTRLEIESIDIDGDILLTNNVTIYADCLELDIEASSSEEHY